MDDDDYLAVSKANDLFNEALAYGWNIYDAQNPDITTPREEFETLPTEVEKEILAQFMRLYDRYMALEDGIRVPIWQKYDDIAKDFIQIMQETGVNLNALLQWPDSNDTNYVK